MRVLSSLILVALIAPFAFGQRIKTATVVTDGRGALFSKPPAAALSRFSHPTGAYSATFAGKPVSSRAMHRGILILSETAVRPASRQRVTFLVYGAALKNEFAFENYRNSTRETSDEATMKETAVKLGGRIALQFDSKRGTSRRLTRVLADGARFFEFEFTIENWPKVEESPARIEAVEQEAARFFDSATINPEPVVDIPFDILGEWRDGAYVNKFLGFTLPFETRYVPVEPGELEAAQKNAMNAFKVRDEGARAQLNDSIDKEIVLGALRNADGPQNRPNIVFSVRRVGPYYTIWELAEASMAAFSQVENYEIVGSFNSGSIGGQQYVSWSMEGSFGAVILHQTLYLFLKDGFAVVLLANSDDKLKTAELRKAVEKIRWNPPAAAKKPSK